MKEAFFQISSVDVDLLVGATMDLSQYLPKDARYKIKLHFMSPTINDMYGLISFDSVHWLIHSPYAPILHDPDLIFYNPNGMERLWVKNPQSVTQTVYLMILRLIERSPYGV